MNEDAEMRELDRLRQDFHFRNRFESDPLADLRASAARRGAQQEAIRASRHLRDIQKAHMASEAALARRQVLVPTAAHDLLVPPAVSQADALGAMRRAEIEAKLVAHRRAMRDIHEKRREREFDAIRDLAGRGKRVLGGDGGENTSLRGRRYSMAVY